MGDELGERLARLEATQDGRDALLKAELSGYLRGQLDSVNNNINATHADLMEAIKELRSVVNGSPRDPGLADEVWRIKVQLRLLAIVVAAVTSYLTGLKLGLIA